MLFKDLNMLLSGLCSTWSSWGAAWGIQTNIPQQATKVSYSFQVSAHKCDTEGCWAWSFLFSPLLNPMYFPSHFQHFIASLNPPFISSSLTYYPFPFIPHHYNCKLFTPTPFPVQFMYFLFKNSLSTFFIICYIKIASYAPSPTSKRKPLTKQILAKYLKSFIRFVPRVWFKPTLLVKHKFNKHNLSTWAIQTMLNNRVLITLSLLAQCKLLSSSFQNMFLISLPSNGCGNHVLTELNVKWQRSFGVQ